MVVLALTCFARAVNAKCVPLAPSRRHRRQRPCRRQRRSVLMRSTAPVAASVATASATATAVGWEMHAKALSARFRATKPTMAVSCCIGEPFDLTTVMIGKCVAPNQCECNPGFTGLLCLPSCVQIGKRAKTARSFFTTTFFCCRFVQSGTIGWQL